MAVHIGEEGLLIMQECRKSPGKKQFRRRGCCLV
jgi:hypothetical protein